MSGTLISWVAMSLLLGGLATRRAGLGCRGSGRFFLGPSSNRLVFGDAALCVFGGVVGRPHLPLGRLRAGRRRRSEEHTSELQTLMRNSYAVFCLIKQREQPTRIE